MLDLESGLPCHRKDCGCRGVPPTITLVIVPHRFPMGCSPQKNEIPVPGACFYSQRSGTCGIAFGITHLATKKLAASLATTIRANTNTPKHEGGKCPSVGKFSESGGLLGWAISSRHVAAAAAAAAAASYRPAGTEAARAPSKAGAWPPSPLVPSVRRRLFSTWLPDEARPGQRAKDNTQHSRAAHVCGPRSLRTSGQRTSLAHGSPSLSLTNRHPFCLATLCAFAPPESDLTFAVPPGSSQGGVAPVFPQR